MSSAGYRSKGADGVGLNLGAGVLYWLDSPDSGPEGFALRFTLTLLFPRQFPDRGT